MKKLRNIALSSMLLCSTNSYALGLSSDINTVLAGAQSAFDSLAENFTAATSYKAITPAEPLGVTGIDIGFEASLTSLTGMDQWGAALGGTDIAYLPLPKLHAHKGLPMGIDVGAFYVPDLIDSGISLWGAELRYSFVGGNVALPAVSVRGAFSSLAGVDALDVSTKSLEATVSKGLLMFTPYAGVGNVWGSVSSAGFAESNPSLFKWFVGMNMNMGLMNLAFEMDQTGENSTYSGKLGFRF